MGHRFKSLVDSLVVPAVRRVAPVRRLISYIGRSVGEDGYSTLKARFIANGASSPFDSDLRREMINKFEAIDKALEAATSPTDGLFLAEAAMSLRSAGGLVECGCFNGASTAKLSIVAKAIGRDLDVFDSFEGLPEAEGQYRRDFHVRRSSATLGWRPGDYAARLELVKANVARYGQASVCRYHKGWFSDTLTDRNLPTRIALAFVDVDLASSAKDCLLALWPRVVDQGLYFSHDVAFVKVLQTILDDDLWRQRLGETRPILFGAGFGLVDASPHLGFFVKGDNVDADYINSLTLEK